MAIPEYERRVEPDRIQAGPPEELHPVAAAFGGQIGEALASGADRISSRLNSLAEHMTKMNKAREEAQSTELLNKYKVQFQDQILGNPTDPDAKVEYVPSARERSETEGLSFKKDEGAPSIFMQPVERPLGVYNWTDNQAHGSIDYIDQWHQRASDSVIQQAQALGIKDLSKLKNSMDNTWVSQRWAIAKHEAQQLDAAQQKTFLSGMQIDANNAVTRQDASSLSKTIDSINIQNTALNDSQHKDADDPVRELTANKFIGQALNNSMMSNLKANGGNPAEFQGIIDTLRDDGKINDTVYQNINDKLDSTAVRIQKEIDRDATSQLISNRMNIISQLASNKVDLSNADQMASELGIKDPKLGEAIKAAADSKSWGQIKAYEPSNSDNDAFSSMAQDIFKAKSQKEISDFMIRAFHSANKGEISQDRLNIIVSAAMLRNKGLPIGSKYDVSTNFDPATKLIDNAADSISKWAEKTENKNPNLWTRFMTMIGQKMPAQQAHDEAIKQTQQDNNPISVKYKIGDSITNSKTGDIGEVIGLNDKGVPLIRVKKGGKPKPERQPTK